MSDTYYQPKAHADAHLQVIYGKDRVHRRNIDTKKRVDSSRPFQGDEGGVGIGGVRRRRKIDKAIDDMS